MEVCTRIRKVLGDKNISQLKLSSDTGISPTKINLILTGKRNIKIEELEIICWALGCKPEELITPKPPIKE